MHFLLIVFIVILQVKTSWILKKNPVTKNTK